MKLSFSTRGWAGMNWAETLRAATEMHFNGIEVYNPYKWPELLAKDGPLHKYTLPATVRQLREANLEIPCFDTYFDLSAEGDETRARLSELIALAAEAHVPYVITPFSSASLKRSKGFLPASFISVLSSISGTM